MNDLSLTPLLESYRAAPSPGVMAQLVEGYLPLSRAIACRFAGRGVDVEDLEQVAAMALMKAIERFEPARGLKFSTFAAPTIAGEVRNYIRDKGAMVRISRDTRSQLHRLQQVQEELTRRLQREPSMREIADEMHVTYDEVLRWLDQRDTADTLSLNAPLDEEGEQEMEARLGVTDAGFEEVEQREWLQWIFRQVTMDERTMLELRYIERLGQRETAKRMNVSQMQVSRMERRVLTRLRGLTERWQGAQGSRA